MQTVRVIGSLPVYDAAMRRFLIGLVLVLLLVASIGVGITVARWPELMISWRASSSTRS